MYGACGEIPRRTRSDSVAGDPLAHRLEPLGDGVAALAEHLEVDRAAQAEVGTGRRRRAAEAAVADGRDARAQALERPQPGDVLHVLDLDARLALDVHADPVAEGQPVAEAGVDRVLEMGVRVDEAGDDGRVGVARALAELRRGTRRRRSGRPRSPPPRRGWAARRQGSTQSAERITGEAIVFPRGLALLRVGASVKGPWALAGPSPASPATEKGVSTGRSADRSPRAGSAGPTPTSSSSGRD